MFYVALVGLIFNLLFCLVVALMTNGGDFSFTPRLFVDGPFYIQGALTMIKNNEWFFTVGDIYHSSFTQIELRPMSWKEPYNCKTGLFSIAMVNNFFSNSSGV